MPSMDQSQWGKNPFLTQQADALRASSNQNLMQNVMPGIRGGAQSAGQYGGSRQGIAEGVASGNAETGLNSAIANMYSTGYGQDQNYSLQQDQMQNQMAMENMRQAAQAAALKQQGELANRGLDLQGTQQKNAYDLGLRGSDLGFGQLDYQINQGNFNNQLAGANLGLQAWNAMQGANQGGLGIGTDIQQTPYNQWSGFNTAANNVGQGLSGNTNTQQMPGSPMAGALGGWQLGSTIGKNLGFGSSAPQSMPMSW